MQKLNSTTDILIEISLSFIRAMDTINFIYRVNEILIKYLFNAPQLKINDREKYHS